MSDGDFKDVDRSTSTGETGQAGAAEAKRDSPSVKAIEAVGKSIKELEDRRSPQDLLALVAVFLGWGTTLRYALLISVRSGTIFLIFLLVFKFFGS